MPPPYVLDVSPTHSCSNFGLKSCEGCRADTACAEWRKRSSVTAWENADALSPCGREPRQHVQQPASSARLPGKRINELVQEVARPTSSVGPNH